MKLICGDALEVLKTLPEGSVDAVVTDPPYGQTNERYDSDIAWRPDVWRECYRAARPNAALVSFAGSPTYHRIASAVEAAGWKVRQMWAWVYRDGMITSAYPEEGFDRLAPAMDAIVFATKGKILLNAEREGAAWKATRNTAGYSERAALCRTTGATGHYPRTVTAEAVPGFEYFLLGRTNHAARKEGKGHPNCKPLALMYWLVSRLPGGTVLDPFMGSGTTGVAAVRGGRDFVGVEINPDYFAVAERRIAEAEACRDGRGVGELFDFAPRQESFS